MNQENQENMPAPVDFDSLEVLEPLSPNALSGIRVPSAFGSGHMNLSSAASGSLGLPELPSRGLQEPRTAAASSAERTAPRTDEIQSRAQSLPVEIAEGERGGSGTSESHEKAREKNRRNQRTFRQRQKAKAQQQDEELATANSRVAELEEQVTVLQQLLAPDLGSSSTGALALPAPGETSLEARIQASSSALQLDRALLLVKEGKLQGLIQQYLDEGGSLPASLPLSASLLAISDQPLSHARFIASRKQDLQSFTPGPGWDECTPAPMEQLYSAILEGRLDLRLPLANGQAPERAILLSRLVAMPAQQHMQLQAQYHACLAQAAPFCQDPQSSHSKHFQAVMGEAVALLAVFAECLPEQFLACQSVNMLDGVTKMPAPAFEALKAASLRISLDTNQLAAAQLLPVFAGLFGELFHKSAFFA
ncbi:hypothetical protein WJX84_007572 [Apatococcus fuscideae]|uniref:BZIP domain-containing protein n=1 Tax=Apatococcus fuscideae TaxID=2026836 RepID=A0AAW1SKZ6_9CHLO